MTRICSTDYEHHTFRVGTDPISYGEKFDIVLIDCGPKHSYLWIGPRSQYSYVKSTTQVRTITGPKTLRALAEAILEALDGVS